MQGWKKGTRQVHNIHNNWRILLELICITTCLSMLSINKYAVRIFTNHSSTLCCHICVFYLYEIYSPSGSTTCIGSCTYSPSVNSEQRHIMAAKHDFSYFTPLVKESTSVLQYLLHINYKDKIIEPKNFNCKIYKSQSIRKPRHAN